MALSDAAKALQEECGAATWRDLAARAGVGYRVACRTVDNMYRAGELERVGSAKREHSRRWMALYEPSAKMMANQGAGSAPTTVLSGVLRGWVGHAK